MRVRVTNTNYHKSYYTRNREKILKRQMEYRQTANRKKQVFTDLHSSNGRFKRAKRMAKFRGLSWQISLNDYEKLIGEKCTYCSHELNPTGVGLDRLDNSQGYLGSNVVPCCSDCNRLRGDRLTPEEARVAVSAIAIFRAVGKVPSNVISLN